MRAKPVREIEQHAEVQRDGEYLEILAHRLLLQLRNTANMQAYPQRVRSRSSVGIGVFMLILTFGPRWAVYCCHVCYTKALQRDPTRLSVRPDPRRPMPERSRP